MARRLPLEIPQSVEELTAGWLTDAVRSSGLARDASVVAFKAGSPGSGVGFQGQTIRVSLDWNSAELDAPDGVLVKFLLLGHRVGAKLPSCARPSARNNWPCPTRSSGISST